MNNYLKLVHMEVHRFRFILFGLMIFTALIQGITIIIGTLGQIAQRRSPDWLASEASFGSFYSGDTISLAAVISRSDAWFSIPILVCVAALLVYVPLIWYRDWFGQRTFIYRLLMLPSARMHIYWSKLTAILIFVFSLVAFQWLLLIAENGLFRLMVPADLYAASHYSDIVGVSESLQILMPTSVSLFLASYALGAIGVMILFTAILIERSYRRIGIVLAIGYAALCAIILFATVIVCIDHSIMFLYPNELLIAGLLVFALITAVTIWLGLRLLSKKVSV